VRWAEGPEEGAERVMVSSAEPLLVTPEGSKARAYRGSLVVTAKEGRLTLVNVVPLEEYLRGVVPAEMPSSFAPEALKAQAIAARTYAMATRKHGADGYDLCDGTHCQVYLGVEEEDPPVDAAIRETAGLILTCQGKPISAVYHDTCGGCTAGNDEVWAGAPATYLRPVSDRVGVPAACESSPRARWERRVSQEAFVAALASAGVRGRLKLIAPEGCEDGTRPERYCITTEAGKWEVGAAKMRELLNRGLGPQTLLSPYFAAQVERETVAITGWGNGHGVGMCQWGANGLAKAGWRVEEILKHYYAGTRVERR
jgi:stage II sporulation protein D